MAEDGLAEFPSAPLTLGVGGSLQEPLETLQGELGVDGEEFVTDPDDGVHATPVAEAVLKLKVGLGQGVPQDGLQAGLPDEAAPLGILEDLLEGLELAVQVVQALKLTRDLTEFLMETGDQVLMVGLVVEQALGQTLMTVEHVLQAVVEALDQLDPPAAGVVKPSGVPEEGPHEDQGQAPDQQGHADQHSGLALRQGRKVALEPLVSVV
jgi:hypothetical protein